MTGPDLAGEALIGGALLGSALTGDGVTSEGGNSAAEALAVHQLLGRIVYFHVLFIEPVLQPCDRKNAPQAPCCNHRLAPGRPSVEQLLEATAWNVVDDVATSISPSGWACPKRSGDCCASCRVSAAGATIAQGWARTEQREYHRPPLSETTLRGFGLLAGARLSRTFSARHAATCAALERRGLGEDSAPPNPQDLPLTGELLALWADPAATSRQPVVSWLNHCAGLDDARRVLQARRSR